MRQGIEKSEGARSVCGAPAAAMFVIPKAFRNGGPVPVLFSNQPVLSTLLRLVLRTQTALLSHPSTQAPKPLFPLYGFVSFAPFVVRFRASSHSGASIRKQLAPVLKRFD